MSVHQLFYLQEIERDTWNKLTKRLAGINQARHMNQSDMFKAGELPYMFNNWKEYREHLLDNLVTDKEYRKKFANRFKLMDSKYSMMVPIHIMYKVHIATILAMDIDFTKCQNWEQKPEAITFRRWKRGDMEFVNKSKTTGEPPLMLAMSVFYAIKDAVASFGEYKVIPKLDAPATPEKILMSLNELKSRIRYSG